MTLLPVMGQYEVDAADGAELPLLVATRDPVEVTLLPVMGQEPGEPGHERTKCVWIYGYVNL